MDKIFYTISGRDKCYKFLQFLEKFLTSANKNPERETLHWIIKQINHSIGLTRHINKFGGTIEYIQKLKQILKSKMIFCLSLNELFLICSDILNILDTFIDHLIFLCKMEVINKNKKLTLKEKCKIIKCIFDYIVLLNYSCQEYILPKWLFAIFGMISSALSIYTTYLLE